MNAEELKPLQTCYMRHSTYAVGSRIDANALGGFARSDNMPRKNSTEDPPIGKSLLLIVDPQHPVPFQAYPGAYPFQGLRLRLINPTGQEVAIPAMDSLIPLICEALDETNTWKPIEYQGRSDCGNSYHTVFLPAGHEWVLAAPVYAGSIKTRLRYVLQIPNGQKVYSNEYEATIERGQWQKAPQTVRHQTGPIRPPGEPPPPVSPELLKLFERLR